MWIGKELLYSSNCLSGNTFWFDSMTVLRSKYAPPCGVVCVYFVTRNVTSLEPFVQYFTES